MTGGVRIRTGEGKQGQTQPWDGKEEPSLQSGEAVLHKTPHGPNPHVTLAQLGSAGLSFQPKPCGFFTVKARRDGKCTSGFGGCSWPHLAFLGATWWAGEHHPRFQSGQGLCKQR